MTEILVRYFHFIGILSLASMLVAENILFSKTLSQKALKKLLVIDVVYGVSAVITLVAGLLLWFVVGKPSDFYSYNILFQIKVALFVLIALLSVLPTVFLLRNRNITVTEISLPGHLILLKRIELILLLALPLLAVLMAQGYGNGYW